MALYLISYNLSDQDAPEYQPLWDFLKQSGAVKVLASACVVEHEVGQVSHLYAKIRPLLQPLDRLLIHEIFRETAFDNLGMNDEDFRELLYKSARDSTR